MRNGSRTTLIEQGVILSNLLITFWLFTDLFIKEDAFSMLTALCVISLLMFIVYSFSGKLTTAHFMILMIAAFTFAAFAANSLDYLYMKRWMMFIAFLLYASVCANIQASTKTLVWITVLNSLQSLLLLFYALLPSSYFMGVLEYCYNPNSASLRLIYLLITSVVAQRMFRRAVRPFLRAIWHLMNCGLCVCIYLTGSRGTLIGLIAFFAVLILYRKAKYNFSVKVNRVLIAVCIVFPLLFVLVYYLLVQNMPGFDIRLFGYTISTRNQMWFTVIDNFKNNWFCGDYYNNQGMPHNGYIDMINAYGYPVTLAFMWMIYRCIQKINRGGWVNVAIVAGLIALILEATGEAASFMGDYRGVMIANLFLFRAVPVDTPQNKETAP